MRVIPVIDLLDEQVVHAVGGDRANYRPVSSRLVDTSAPEQVARAFVAALSVAEIYVADLNAITGKAPQWDAIQRVASSGAKLLVDLGAENAEQAGEVLAKMQELRVEGRIVIGLETLSSIEELARIGGTLESRRVVFSLDLRQGKPLTRIAEWHDCSSQLIARAALDAGVASFIVLDLAGVGTEAGVPTLDVCRWLREAAPTAEIISGGGVRTSEDLLAMKQAGCDAALVATALHNLAIGRAEIERLLGEQ